MEEGVPDVVQKIAGSIRIENACLVLDGVPADFAAAVPQQARKGAAAHLVSLAVLLADKSGDVAKPAIDKICLVIVLLLGDVAQAMAMFASKGLTTEQQRVIGSTWSNRPIEKSETPDGCAKSGPALQHALKEIPKK